MQKRRERIEKWRTDRKKGKEALPINIAPPSKKWSLEDDDDEEDETSTSTQNLAEDEVDPLDAYMLVGGINIADAETRIFQDDWNNAIVADALAPCVARSPAALVLTAGVDTKIFNNLSE